MSSIKFTNEQNERLKRLERVGGSLVEVIHNEFLTAILGVNQGVHFVIYPDGSMDRFEKNEFVKYRTSWVGPLINDPASLEKRRLEALDREQNRLIEEKERKRLDRKAKRDGLSKMEVLQQKYEIEIPELYQGICELAKPVFDFFFDRYGDSTNRRIGTSTREIENWMDPEYILDTVIRKVSPFISEDEVMENGPEIQYDEFQEFIQLERKYQLAISFQYCGVLPY
jgi:hypothetical protein